MGRDMISCVWCPHPDGCARAGMADVAPGVSACESYRDHVGAAEALAIRARALDVRENAVVPTSGFAPSPQTPTTVVRFSKPPPRPPVRLLPDAAPPTKSERAHASDCPHADRALASCGCRDRLCELSGCRVGLMDCVICLRSGL